MKGEVAWYDPDSTVTEAAAGDEEDVDSGKDKFKKKRQNREARLKRRSI